MGRRSGRSGRTRISTTAVGPAPAAATAAALLISFGGAVGAATTPVTTFTNAAGNGLWGDALNWTAGLPNATTRAEVGQGFGYSISLGGVTRTAASVSNGGGLESTSSISTGTLNTAAIVAGGHIDLNASLINTVSTQLTIQGEATFNGTIGGSGYSVVIDEGNFFTPPRFAAINSYTGSTFIRGATLDLSGRISNSPLIEVDHGLLRVLVANAFGGSSQTLRLRSGAIQVNSTATLPKMHLTAGPSAFSGLMAAATSPSVTRDAGATLVYDPNETSNLTRLKFTTPPMLFGDSTTPTRLPVAPWAILPISDPTLMTHDATGLRWLAAAEFAGAIADGENVRLDASTVTVSTPASVNSLTLRGTSLALDAPLTVTSGGIVFSPHFSNASAATINGSGSLVLPTEGIVHAYSNNGFPSVTTHSINVPISGGALVKAGNGNLALNAPNSYTGGTFITGGVLIAANAATLGSGPVTLTSSAGGELTTLRFLNPIANFSNALVVAALAQDGVRLEAPTGSTLNLSGAVSGNGEILLQGATFRYTGVSAPGGNYLLVLTSGALLIDGIIASPTSSVGNTGTGTGTLGGNGTIAGELRPVGMTFSPGDAAAGDPGRLTAAVGNFYGNTMRFDINGAAAADDFDQLVMTTSLLLSPNPINDNDLGVLFGFSPAQGQQFKIIDDLFPGPVDGFFAGLPEGSVFTRGGHTLHITYAGGDGNDVVLTVVPEPAAAVALPTLIAIAALGRRRRRLNRR